MVSHSCWCLKHQFYLLLIYHYFYVPMNGGWWQVYKRDWGRFKQPIENIFESISHSNIDWRNHIFAFLYNSFLKGHIFISQSCESTIIPTLDGRKVFQVFILLHILSKKSWLWSWSTHIQQPIESTNFVERFDDCVVITLLHLCEHQLFVYCFVLRRLNAMSSLYNAFCYQKGEPNFF